MSKNDSMLALPFMRGDEITLTADQEGAHSQRSLKAGVTGVVDDYVSAADSDNGEAFYWITLEGHEMFWVLADRVELKRSAATMAARELPTTEEVVQALGGTIGDWTDLDIDESEPDGDGVIFYGKTAEGLSFAVTVRIESIEHADV